MITIHKAGGTEVRDLQELNNSVFVDNIKYDSDLDMSWALSSRGNEYFTDSINNSQACIFIAQDGNKKIGYIVAAPKIVPFCKSNYIEIENMGVLPKYRSKGIGTLLIDKCFAWARQQGYQKAYVNSYIKNVHAVSFYKKHGFSEIDLCLQKNL